MPGTLADCCEIVVTRNKAEIEAVRAVLSKFFHLEDDGLYHQKRADAEIGRFRDKSEKAQRSANARWKGNGGPPPRNAKASKPHMPPDSGGNANAPPNAMRSHSEGNAPRGAMHTQSPVTSNQTPIPFASANGARAGAGEACKAMREAGLAEVNPSNPTLATMLQQGMTVAELADAARTAVAEGKGFAWALKRAIGRREDAARVALAPAPPRAQFMADILAGAPVEEDHDEPDARARG